MNKEITMIENNMNSFTQSTIQFLNDLKANNNREWFQKNKHRYESDVLIPAFNFISSIGEEMPKFAPNFTAIPKRMGGSIMRVYRDTRFSKDKTPYKTNIGIQFRHRSAKDVHSPGYYVHIAPDDFFVGIGTWRPPSDALLKIREHIIEHPGKWISARDDKSFRSEFELAGEKLKTAPRGFDKDHELIDDLRWKDFIASRSLSEEFVLAEDFIMETVQLFKFTSPYMKFLCDALGVPF
jgi:uncharacterized protein (TIGR02453 family)